ncbi:hypothetical protein V495_03866, partial [Pseudogymnoascus sp. VKM F-4514 (FW-929)]
RAGDGFYGGLRYSWITARTLLTSSHLASPDISHSRRRWDDLESTEPVTDMSLLHA